MATIVQSEVKIYAGTTATGTQVGNTITTLSAATTVNVNEETLGVSLDPGKQYCAIARCTNSEEFTSEWTSPYTFQTLANAGLMTVQASANNIIITGEVNTTDVIVTEAGVYYSTSATGQGAVKKAGSVQEFEQGLSVTGLAEATTYYIVAYVKDSNGREWRDEWTSAEEVETGNTKANITISSTSSTYNSITANYSISTTTALTSAEASIRNTGGGSIYRFNLPLTAGTNTITITDGDEDKNGNTIQISPSTSYSVTVEATNTGGSNSTTATVTTESQSESEIEIVSITGITPYSAVVNLSFSE